MTPERLYAINEAAVKAWYAHRLLSDARAEQDEAKIEQATQALRGAVLLLVEGSAPRYFWGRGHSVVEAAAREIGERMEAGQ